MQPSFRAFEFKRFKEQLVIIVVWFKVNAQATLHLIVSQVVWGGFKAMGSGLLLLYLVCLYYLVCPVAWWEYKTDSSDPGDGCRTALPPEGSRTTIISRCLAPQIPSVCCLGCFRPSRASKRERCARCKCC